MSICPPAGTLPSRRPGRKLAASAFRADPRDDDELFIRTIFKSMLKQFGYESVQTADGQTAVELYPSESGPTTFRCRRPRLDGARRHGGREAMQALLALDPDVRAIVMSGYSDDEVMRTTPDMVQGGDHQTLRLRPHRRNPGTRSGRLARISKTQGRCLP